MDFAQRQRNRITLPSPLHKMPIMTFLTRIISDRVKTAFVTSVSQTKSGNGKV
jgi:hypothetical protein